MGRGGPRTIGLLVLVFGLSAPLAGGEVPLDPSRMDARRAAVLSYLTGLSTGQGGRFLGAVVGQNCFHGDQILDTSWERGFRTMVEDLHDATGQWVGIVGLDYEFARLFTPEQLSRANRVLADYARAGGLVTINLTPLNPWVNDESDLIGNPGAWDGPAGPPSQTGLAKVTSLNDLIDPSQAVSRAWTRKLDRIAAALAELRDAGVVVLFRPLQEMNGGWFWWGMRSHPQDPRPYVNLFRHMHRYFTEVKGLNNLLWVYSPNASYGQDNRSTWNRTVDWAYPGADVVDLVAGTYYGDSLVLEDYPTYLKLKKPLGMAELGPKTDGLLAKAGTWDIAKILPTLRDRYPRIGYFVCWHSYPGESWSIVANRNPGTLMNDPLALTRDRLPPWP